MKHFAAGFISKLLFVGDGHPNKLHDGNLTQWVYQNPDPEWVDEFIPTTAPP